MAQCKGTTRKGEQCKRDAKTGSAYCSIHIDQEIRPPREKPAEAAAETEWDREAITMAALGFALVGAILFFRIRR